MARSLINAVLGAMIASCQPAPPEALAPASAPPLSAYVPAPTSHVVRATHTSSWGERSSERAEEVPLRLSLNSEANGVRTLTLEGGERRERWTIEGTELSIEVDGVTHHLPPLGERPPWTSPDGTSSVTTDGECVTIVTHASRELPAAAAWPDITRRDERTWCLARGEVRAERTVEGGPGSRRSVWERVEF